MEIMVIDVLTFIAVYTAALLIATGVTLGIVLALQPGPEKVREKNDVA